MGKRKDNLQHRATAARGPSRGKRGRPPSDKPSYGEWRAWWATVTTGSFSRAATKLGVRKAMVQRAVQVLQAKLQNLLHHPGLQLYMYDAATRAVRPTDNGQTLFLRIRDAVGTLEDVNRIIEPLRRRSELCVATSETLWQTEIMDLVGKVKERFPDADIAPYVHGSRKCLQQLAEGMVDVAFVAAEELSNTPLAPGTTAVRYGDYPIKLVVRKGSRLAKNVVFWQELEGTTTSVSDIPQDVLNHLLHEILEARLILPGRFSTFRRFVEKHLFKQVKLDNIQELRSGALIMGAVVNGLGVTLQQSYVVDSYLASHPGVSEKLIWKELTRILPRWHIAMVFDENRLGDTAKALVDAVRNRRS